MTLVRGRDSAVGVEHTDGVSADGAAGTYGPYPLISFDHSINPVQMEEPDELIAQGARETVPPSKKEVLGTMVLRPRFDDPQFLKILANVMGGTETRVLSADVENNNGAGWVNSTTHIFEAGNLQPRQWIRMNLGAAGLRIDSTCKFSKLVWEHVANAAPKVSIDVLGIGPSTGTAAALAVHDGLYPIRATSLEWPIVAPPISGSAFKWRPTPGAGNWVDAPNITSMKITLDHQMVQSGSYVDSASAFAELADGDKTRTVEVELEGEMPTGLASTDDHPYYSYVNGTAFGLDIIYSSGPNTTPGVSVGTSAYRMRLHIPNIVPTGGTGPIDTPGVLTWSVKGTAIQSTEWYTAGTEDAAPPPSDHEVPAAGIDFRILAYVSVLDETANNTGSYFCHQHA